jgi:hypothetical protein
MQFNAGTVDVTETELRYAFDAAGIKSLEAFGHLTITGTCVLQFMQ